MCRLNRASLENILKEFPELHSLFVRIDRMQINALALKSCIEHGKPITTRDFTCQFVFPGINSVISNEIFDSKIYQPSGASTP